MISTLIAKPQTELAEFIASIPIWTWPRSDLNSWTKVLNRFDGILSDLIDKYNLHKLQLGKFDVADKKILIELLRFERMLLENSTNRKLFASYDVSRPAGGGLPPLFFFLVELIGWGIVEIECFTCDFGFGRSCRCVTALVASFAAILFTTAHPPFSQYLSPETPSACNAVAWVTRSQHRITRVAG